jgi:hypothetical protein
MDHDIMTGWRLLPITVILVCGLVPDETSGDGQSRVRASLKSNLFNQSDLERIERGYYERLADAGRRLDDLADLPSLRLRGRAGAAWSVPVDAAPLVMRINDLREVVLKQGAAADQSGVQWRTSAMGMRDRWYPTQKSTGTFRIALVGDSIGAGWGVNVEDRFESILERLWDTRVKDAGGESVEIIDCAVPGHSPGQRWYHFAQIGWPMHPDLVICESTAADAGWDERRLRYLLARGIGWDSPLYSQVLARAGVKPFGSPDEYKRALRPCHWDILAGVYRAMVDDCRAHGVPIVWVLVPRVGRKRDEDDQRSLKRIAVGAGFSHVVDVSDAYDGIDPSKLAISTGDFHPNAYGHAHLAERIDIAFSSLPEFCGLWTLVSDDGGQPVSGQRDGPAGLAPKAQAHCAISSTPKGGQPR